MRAAVYYGKRDIRLEEVDEPVPGHGEVRLSVSFNGLCGTDLHEYFDGQRAVPSSPHPLTGAHAPLILGHEIAGVVTDLGPGASGVAVGDLVAVEPIVGCRSCSACRSDQVNMCDQLAFHGLSTGGGGLAQYTVVPVTMVHVAPPGVGPREAAMAEPLAVAWHAVRRSGVTEGQCAAVIGSGPIGLGIVAVLNRRGVRCIVVEPSDNRRRLAQAIGATTVDPSDGSAATQIRDLTGGAGVDVCFETSATIPGFETAMDSTAKHGVMMLLASPRQPLPPVLGRALARELEIRTSYAYCGDFPAVLEALASGELRFDGWVTTAGMSSLHDVLESMRAGDAAKVLIDPSA